MLLGFSCHEEMTDRGEKAVLGLSCTRGSAFSGRHVCAEAAGPVSLPGLPCDTDRVFDARISEMPAALLLWNPRTQSLFRFEWQRC